MLEENNSETCEAPLAGLYIPSVRSSSSSIRVRVELRRLDGPSLSILDFSSARVVSSTSSAIFSTHKSARSTPQFVGLGLGAVNAAALRI